MNVQTLSITCVDLIIPSVGRLSDQILRIRSEMISSS